MEWTEKIRGHVVLPKSHGASQFAMRCGDSPRRCPVWMYIMMKWFHSLKVAQKLALISVLFMVPDSIMLYLFITSINENIHFAKLEQIGNEYQRALEPLLELIPEHR